MGMAIRTAQRGPFIHRKLEGYSGRMARLLWFSHHLHGRFHGFSRFLSLGEVGCASWSSLPDFNADANKAEMLIASSARRPRLHLYPPDGQIPDFRISETVGRPVKDLLGGNSAEGMGGVSVYVLVIEVAHDPPELLVEVVGGSDWEQKVPRCQSTPVSGPEAVNRTECPVGWGHHREEAGADEY